MTRFVCVFQSVSFLCLILTYFNIDRSCSQLLCKKKYIYKFCKLYKKNFFLSPFLTNCRPRTCNCIKIGNPAQVFSSDFGEISQNSLLQNNRGMLLHHKSYLKTGRKLCQSAILLKLSAR